MIEDELFELGKQDIFNEKIMDVYIRQVKTDIKRIFLEEKINNFNVMDVGTGRQALALKKIGARSVIHLIYL